MYLLKRKIINITTPIFVILFVLSLTASGQYIVIKTDSTFTVPRGVSQIKVECWGGGGGGGSAIIGSGGGGGGGAYNVATFNVSANDTYTIIIGKGGASDTPGDTTTVTDGGTNLVVANGGAAGGLGILGAGTIGTGATGGTYNGGDGATGPGGGGGGAGNAGDGISAIDNLGAAGGAGNPNSYPFIGGNGGDVGGNAAAPGGGGSGTAPALFGAGNPGADGQVVISWSEYIWTGNTDSDFNNGANYEGTPANGPAGKDVLIFSPGITNWPTLPSGNNITIKSLYIESTPTSTGSLIANGTISVSGQATVERYLPSDDWHIISSPVKGQQRGAFASTNGLDMYAGTYDLAPYNEGVGMWDPFNVTAATTGKFNKAKGYIARLPQNAGTGKTVTFTGNNIWTGTITRNIDSTRYGWNSVGNPYTSAIRLNAATNSFLATNASQLSSEYGGLYFWDNVTDDYIIIPNGGSDVISSGQGFVVKCKEGGSKTITFNSAMQVHSSGTALKSETIAPSGITVFVKSGDLINTTQINFLGEKSLGLDPGYDVGKLKGNPDIALYTKLADSSSSIAFGVQALPDVSFDELVIPLGLDLNGGGNITFGAFTTSSFPNDAQVFIEDTELNTRTELKDISEMYEVTLPDIQGFGRFNLILKNYTGKSTATAIKTKNTLENFTLFTQNKQIIVNGPADSKTRFYLYSIDGKLWYNKTAKSTNRNSIDASGFASGVYLLKIQKGENQQTHKLVLSE